MIAKSRPRWVAGDFNRRSTFSRKTSRGFFSLEDPVDRPPEDALLALDPVRLVQRLRDRVVLAREAADEEVVVGIESRSPASIWSRTTLMSSLTCTPVSKWLT